MAFTGKLGTAQSKLGNIELGRGATIAAGGVTQVLSGTSAASSTTTATLRVAVALSKTDSAVGTTSGSLAVARRLSGTSSGVSLTSGTLQTAALPPVVDLPTSAAVAYAPRRAVLTARTAVATVTERVAEVEVSGSMRDALVA